MLRIVFWTVIIVLFLSFFGISVQSLFENPTTQTNFDFIIGLVEEGWNTIWNFITSIVDTVIGVFKSIIPG
jgi:hypothetical protein